MRKARKLIVGVTAAMALSGGVAAMLPGVAAAQTPEVAATQRTVWTDMDLSYATEAQCTTVGRVNFQLPMGFPFQCRPNAGHWDLWVGLPG